MSHLNAVRLWSLGASLLVLFVLVGCAASPPLPSSELPPAPQPAHMTPERTIVVVGNGNMRVQANMAKSHFSVEVVGDTVIEAHRTAGEIMARVVDALAALQIAGDDVQPHSYNVYVERYYEDYERDDPGTVPLFPEAGEQIRYRVMHQLSVTVRDLAAITDVVDAVTTAGGNYVYIYGTDFLYDDPAGLEHEARQKAIADAERKAQEIAQLIGVELGAPRAISELVAGGYSNWDGYGPPLWPGQLQFVMQLQVEYAIIDREATLPAATSTPTTTGSMTTDSMTTTAIAPGSDAQVTESNHTALHDVTIHGGDEAALRAFLRQYFVQTFAPSQGRTDVYIGTLPPTLPFTIDLPANVTVAGSVVNSIEYTNTHLLFSVNGDVPETMALLRGQLEDQGYATPAGYGRHGVFVTASIDYLPLCSPDGKSTLTISGRNLADGVGVLHFYINTMSPDASPCGATTPVEDEFSALLPTLEPPVPISVFQSGGGSDGTGQEMTIRFTAETTVEALAETYNAQMEALGWKQTGASQSELMAWSGWSLRQDSQTYIASLYIAANPANSNRFHSTLRIDKAP